MGTPQTCALEETARRLLRERGAGPIHRHFGLAVTREARRLLSGEFGFAYVFPGEVFAREDLDRALEAESDAHPTGATTFIFLHSWAKVDPSVERALETEFKDVRVEVQFVEDGTCPGGKADSP